MFNKRVANQDEIPGFSRAYSPDAYARSVGHRTELSALGPYSSVFADRAGGLMSLNLVFAFITIAYEHPHGMHLRVASLELRPSTPSLPGITVTPAKNAEPRAKACQDEKYGIGVFPMGDYACVPS